VKGLVKPWIDEERKLIADAIQRLYIYHGLRTSFSDIAVMASELEKIGYDVRSTLRGIEGLKDGGQIQRISVPLIRDEIFNKIGGKTPVRGACDCVCEGTGIIIMQDDSDSYCYTHALACICKKGIHIAEAYRMLQWNGQIRQEFHHQWHELDEICKLILDRKREENKC